MKKLSLSLIFGATLALTACGGHEEHPHAVDKLAEAEAAAKAKAPQAETVKFADEGAETIGGVGGVNPKPVQAADDKAKAEEKTDNTAEAKADDKAENTATENAAKADDKQDDATKADDKKAEEAPAKTEEPKTDDKAAETKKAE